jgi:O-antigen/teichoic acid export membrane protein
MKQKMIMNKKLSSILNTITSLLLVVIQGLLSLLLSREIITNIGSDYNGLNATVSQLIGLLLVLEGGITLASTVAIFKPLVNNDLNQVNGILFVSKLKLRKISNILLILGTPLVILYAYLIQSNVTQFEIIISFIISIFNAYIILGFNTKYRILFQSTNKEYYLNVTKITSYLLTMIVAIVVVKMELSFLLLQIIIASASVLEYILLKFFFKLNFKSFNFVKSNQFVEINGTNDVFAQKITSVLYSSIPILIISASVGTVTASVYFVYKSIFGLIKSLSYSFIYSPRNAIGLQISELGMENTKETYMRYEFASIVISFILITIGLVTIMPFINMFYKTTDTNYISYSILFLVSITSLLELIHIPSGTLINLNSKFKIGKRIQLLATIILSISLAISALFFGLEGILVSILLAALILATLEIYYAHKYLAKKQTKELISILAVNIFTMVLIAYAPTIYPIQFISFFDFIVKASIISVIILFIYIVINTMFNFKYIRFYWNLLIMALQKIKNLLNGVK